MGRVPRSLVYQPPSPKAGGATTNMAITAGTRFTSASVSARAEVVGSPRSESTPRRSPDQRQGHRDKAVAARPPDVNEHR